jgi:two-component system sensor histidine kinase HupT/HoxJ
MGPLIEGTMEGADRISKIVLDLRRYSGVQKERPELFDLCQVINTAIHWVVKAAREPLEVVCDLPDELQITGRQGQVHQILINLLQNAIDVMEGQPHPKLTIRCNKDKSKVRIRVKDEGPGIPQQDLKKIFDPFFTTKAVGKGTGLGLYISYGLARDMGGNLMADNDADSGAIFTLQLPLHGEVDGGL